MPGECGCHGANQNCTYCYGSGYVGVSPDAQAEASRLAQRLEFERSRTAGALRYADAEKRAKAEEQTKAEEQASAMRQALADERRSAEILRRSLAEEQTKADEQVCALLQEFADARRSAATWRAAWEKERDERTNAQRRTTALGYGVFVAVVVVIGLLIMKSCL